MQVFIRCHYRDKRMWQHGALCQFEARLHHLRRASRRFGRQLRDDIPVPLVDGVSSGIVLAEALARLSVTPATAGSFTRPPGKVNQELSLARLHA